MQKSQVGTKKMGFESRFSSSKLVLLNSVTYCVLEKIEMYLAIEKNRQEINATDWFSKFMCLTSPIQLLYNTKIMLHFPCYM